MSDWRQFISVVGSPSPALGAGVGLLTFNLETFDAVTNVSLTITVSGYSTDDEISFARSINRAIHTTLQTTYISVYDPSFPSDTNPINLLYTGIPRFSDQPYWPTFYVGQTDHVLSIWCQAQFRLRIVSNTTGAIVDVGQSPVFTTLREARETADVLGIDYTTDAGECLSDNQLLRLLRNASAQLVALLNNYIVLANYLHEEIGSKRSSIKVRVKPMNDWDYPQIRRPFIIGITTILISKSAIGYQVDRQLGILNYRFTNDLIEISEPFDTNNEIKFTYRAGRLNIPTIIKEKTIQVSSSILEDMAGINKLKGGSGEVDFNKPMDTLRWMITELREYRLDA